MLNSSFVLRCHHHRISYYSRAAQGTNLQLFVSRRIEQERCFILVVGLVNTASSCARKSANEMRTVSLYDSSQLKAKRMIVLLSLIDGQSIDLTGFRKASSSCGLS